MKMETTEPRKRSPKVILTMCICCLVATAIIAVSSFALFQRKVEIQLVDGLVVAKPEPEPAEEPEPTGILCKRATTLHTEVCNQNENYYYCSRAGQVGYGSTITYGNATTTSGVLNTGDAFDCDVDGTGYNHRFYYVSDLYTGGTSGSETWDTNTAVLIYYSNISITGDTISPVSLEGTGLGYHYNNYEGPERGIEYLPSITQWSNVRLKNKTRQIRNELGGNTTTNGIFELPLYTYTNKAARLLTTQELNKGCGLTTSTMNQYYSLEGAKCRFLYENSRYSDNSKAGDH